MRTERMKFDESIQKYINNLRPDEIPDGQCMCGCGQSTPLARQGETMRGYRRGRHTRYAFSHNRGIASTERFYEIDQSTGCWIWQRRTTENYGVAVITSGGKKRNWKAHILYYTLYKGAVPTGLVLDHKCRNTRCVNPEHLEPVTHVENVRRGKNAKITMQIAEEIRSLHAVKFGGYRKLAAKFGISAPQVAKIVKGLSWSQA